MLALWVAGFRFKVEGSAESFEPSTFNLQRLSAFLAGLIYAFSPHQFGHLSQLQLLSIAWLPLTLLFLDRFWINGGRKDGALFALCAVFQTLSAFYYGFQVALAVGLYLLVRLVTAPNRNTVHRLAALLPWIALAALLIAPFAVPYLRVRSELGLERSIGETLQNAATLAEYLRPPAANPIYRAMPGLASVESGLFPGLIVLALAVLGVITWPRRRYPANLSSLVTRHSSLGRGYWLLLFFAAVILSLGPRLKLAAADPGGITLPFAWLYAHVPGMTAIRAPGRFANTAFLALAILAAMGAAWLLGKIPPVVRRQTSNVTRHSLVFRLSSFVAIAALILAEYAGGLGRFEVQPMPPTDGPLYAWLAAQPPAAIIELPLTSEMAGKPVGATGSAAPWPDYNLLRTQYFQTGHWQPTVDGYSGFVPPHHRELGLAMAHFPDERSLALLRGLGVERVVVHADLLDAFQPGRAAALRAALAQTPGVSHERDFGSEWVYRLQPESDGIGASDGAILERRRRAGIPYPVVDGWARRGDRTRAAAARAGIVAVSGRWGRAAVRDQRPASPDGRRGERRAARPASTGASGRDHPAAGGGRRAARRCTLRAAGDGQNGRQSSAAPADPDGCKHAERSRTHVRRSRSRPSDHPHPALAPARPAGRRCQRQRAHPRCAGADGRAG